MSEYEARVYVKGDSRRIATSPSAAVALEFDGYKRVEDAKAEEVQAPVQSSTPPPELPEPKTATPVPTPPKQRKEDQS